MTPEQRQSLRNAIAEVKRKMGSSPSPLPDRWELQTSNSFRRIGCHGDGDVLCGTKHPIDGHSDLLAAPGVLDYIVAAQPRVVLELLDMVDEAERVLTTKLDEIEREWTKRLDATQKSLDEVRGVVETLKRGRQ